MTDAMEVDNSWEIESILGKGGFGIVELWKNTQSGEKIAIKKCVSVAHLSSKQKDRWTQEIAIMNKLLHPNIVSIRPVPEEVKRLDSPLPVLCMEYCKKGDLRKMLRKSENCCGLAEPAAFEVMRDISGAVEYLHSQEITHRDLKPENVVLQQLKDKVVYKLIDLGYAKALGHDSIYASIVGTLNYVAPELLWKEKYSCAVDYWSMGILFYEIITGFRPFLPAEANLTLWKTDIKNKSYNDISAKTVNGSVVFQQNIQDPNNMTPCIREALVDWFRLVLQWDSKQRGKEYQNDGHCEIIVFKMLQKILSKKLVHIFCASGYQVYGYEVENTTTIATLRTWIAADTQIPSASQELIDSCGAVLKDNEPLQDTFLTLFRKGDNLMEIPTLDPPTLVKYMIEMPQSNMSLFELKQCYSAALFFVKQEVELFRFYVLALSMKIDLLNSRFDTLMSQRTEMMNGISLLNFEFHKLRESLNTDFKMGCDEWQGEIEVTKAKLMRLSTISNELKATCDNFLEKRNMLIVFGDVDWMTEYEGILCEMEERFDTCPRHSEKTVFKPTPMVMLIIKFLKFGRAHIYDTKFSEIRRLIGHMTSIQVTEEFSKLEKYMESAVELTKVYSQELSILKKRAAHRKPTSSASNVDNMNVESENDHLQSMTSSTYSSDEAASLNIDTVIYDSLVICSLVQDITAETHEKFQRMMNLN